MSFTAAGQNAVVSIEQLSRGSMTWDQARGRLKAGGLFVGAEFLSAHPSAPFPCRTADDVKALLLDRGFQDIRVVDATDATWNPFRQKLKLFLWEKLIDYELDEAMAGDVERSLFGSLEPVLGYVLFSARLPQP